MTWELLNRGGDITQIPKTGEFRWGPSILLKCTAANFLNPYIKSPITVSITGASGMGKTCVMYMIEAKLLLTAAHLAFPYLWKHEDFEGAKTLSLSEDGRRKCAKIEKGVQNLLAKGKDRKCKERSSFSNEQPKNENPLVKILKKYKPQYGAVYKHLACMDFRQLLKTNDQGSQDENQEQSLGAVPRILIVQFSAGNYRDMNEAWVGLAVEITKEIENSMTQAHDWEYYSDATEKDGKQNWEPSLKEIVANYINQ
ncbi:hypothetical protein SUGI_1132390 [Cryptomeria japonica]|nr:hypothetical protein SUGI_1132390 [Cryptomeria japonica]